MSSPSLASLDRFQPDRVAERVVDDPPFAVVAAQHRFLAHLEPGQALVFVADGADHLARHFALRVGAAAVGQLADPFQLQPFDRGAACSRLTFWAT